VEETHSIRSEVIGQTFRIRILMPTGLAAPDERLPVLYATDSDYYFQGIAGITSALQLMGEAPPFVLVGIGYEQPRAVHMLRMRDLWTHSIRTHFNAEIAQLAVSPLEHDSVTFEQVTHTTDASDFLRFLRNELIPFIDARYPTLSGENHYFGYSAGGTFGLYTLFTQPDTFKRYILGSPGTSHSGQHFALELVKSFLESGQRLNADLFLSVGELEEFKKGHEAFELVTGYYQLVKFLKAAAIPGLNLNARLFAQETHATAWTRAFTNGVKTLFGAVDNVPAWPDFLKPGR